MAWVDLLILVAAGWGLFKGLRSGAVQQIAGFAGFFLALVFAAALMDEAGVLLVRSFGLSPRIATLAGFGVVMGGALLVLGILTRGVEKLFEAARIGFVNRALGAGVGMLRSLLVVSALLVPLRALGVPDAQTRAASPFYAPVVALLPWVWDHTGGLVDDGWRLRDQIDALVDAPGTPSTPATTAPPPARPAPNPARPNPNTRRVD